MVSSSPHPRIASISAEHYVGGLPPVDRPILGRHIEEAFCNPFEVMIVSMFVNDRRNVHIPRTGFLIEPWYALSRRSIFSIADSYFSEFARGLRRDFYRRCLRALWPRTRVPLWQKGEGALLARAFFGTYPERAFKDSLARLVSGKWLVCQWEQDKFRSRYSLYYPTRALAQQLMSVRDMD